ncbi:AraC-like ligand-binding domain-containing protein [Streptomyces sp. 7N604]|uniref:AraC-like ligand-binding domain-containing protein n=1 Tax=Streptomyces sp. 7N604 TaxID=3457415 RepID=UPI003FD2D6CF
MRRVLSTASVPVGERLAYWHEVIEQTCVPLDIAPCGDAPFRGSLTADRLGCLQISTIEADANRVRRTKGLIAQADRDHFSVGVQGRSPGMVAQDGREALLSPGDLTFYDTSRPYALSFAEPFRMRVFAIPRQALGLREADLRRITAVPLRPDKGPAALVASFLARLAAEATTYPPHIGDLLARNAVDLLGTLVAEQLGREAADTADAATAALRLRIQSFIDRHLGDPDLSPQTIAAAHHLSVRYVHRLFQSEGTTVSRWIQRRRLEASRRELGRHGPAVAAVAHRFGFTSPSHFSRVFRGAYGMSPREWRTMANRLEPGSPPPLTPGR